MLDSVENFCRSNNIRFIAAGPASRPHTKTEDYLTRKLHNYFENSKDGKKLKLINCLGKLSKDNESLFFENGIHVNEAGHKRIAEFIIKEIGEILRSGELNKINLLKTKTA